MNTFLRSRPATRRRQSASRKRSSGHGRGVVLIEVMVAILLFVTGIVGLIGLQVTMTRAQTEGKLRADAAYLGREMIGRIWSDIPNMAGYDASNCAKTSGCAEWQAKVGLLLPKGTGSVTVDATTGDVVVTVGWTLPSGEAHRFVSRSTVTAKG